MSFLAHWMESWERSLTLRDRHRRIFPFSWGLRWIESDGIPFGDPLEFLSRWSDQVLKESAAFYTPPPLGRWEFRDNRLTFATPTPSRHWANNTVSGRFFPASGAKAAVIVVPQWNAAAHSHVGLCRLLSYLNFSVLRLTLPYHEERCPANMRRADYMVSPNIGRTIHATRQAVLEVRQAAEWLIQQGYERIGLVGTSLGSCIAYLAFTHDRSFSAAVFNHVAAFFADVVWFGLSTRYVRWGLEGLVKLDDLRHCWAPLSPWHFIPRLVGDRRDHLLITAKYDLTFLPRLSDPVFARYRELGIKGDRAVLPCGHYTTAVFPFKYLDGWLIARFLQKHLLHDAFAPAAPE